MPKTAKPKKTTTVASRTLDDLDRQILSGVARQRPARNAALASRTGIAESTCIHRVRALRDSGVISGFHAEVDLGALGLPMQAVVKVRLGTHNRDEVNRFHATLSAIPGVLTIFHVAGEDDYLAARRGRVLGGTAGSGPRARDGQSRRTAHGDAAGVRGDPRGRGVAGGPRLWRRSDERCWISLIVTAPQ